MQSDEMGVNLGCLLTVKEMTVTGEPSGSAQQRHTR